MIRPEIDATALKRLTMELKEIDPGLARQMTKDLKSGLLPFASAIQREMPTESPLSGMVHSGRTGWSPAIVKVSATPGSGWGRSIARIVIEGKPNPAMLKIAEFAGSSNRTKNFGSGRSLITNLDRKGFNLVKGRGGRFGFAAYYKKQPEMLRIIETIIDDFVKMTNKRFD